MPGTMWNLSLTSMSTAVVTSFTAGKAYASEWTPVYRQQNKILPCRDLMFMCLYLHSMFEIINYSFKKITQLELSLEAIHTPTIVHYKAEARVTCVVEKTWALHIP